MTPEYLIEQTQTALGNQEILGIVFNKCFQYDNWIKEEFNGNYDVLPETIHPYQITEQRMVSIVKVKVTRDSREKMYSLLFVFSNEGLSISLTHPGQSNVDPVLFQDVYPLARASVAAKLGTDEVVLKDTSVVGTMMPTGWDEKWVWISSTGQTAETDISFNAVENNGVVFNLKAA